MSDAARLDRGYRIRGRVQGVGFRWWTRSHARRLALSGSVRNCEDGSVEVQVRGPAREMAQFEQLLREGPPGAQVTALEAVAPEQMAQQGFVILH